jgi:transposase-like protein
MAQEHKKEPRGIPQGTLPVSAQQLLDDMVTGPMTPEAMQDAFVLLKKAFIERALGAELGHHLGYSSGQPKSESSQNQRNGSSAKTVLTDTGPVRLDIPRDRDGSFEPILIPKHERRFTGFDDKIIAMTLPGFHVQQEDGSFLLTENGNERKQGAQAALYGRI